MLSEERRRRLLEAVQSKGSLTVGEAEKSLAVSRMTVHRDLDVLAAQGLVRKVHGGVVALKPKGSDLFDPRARPFEERVVANKEAKRAIAKHVAKIIGKARTLILDASTTVYCLAEALPQGGESRDLFVVTGGLPLFSELLRRREGIRAALHGGEPHQRTGSLIGPLALASIADMRFDWAIISALGVVEDEDAVYVSNPEEVEVKRGYLQRARKTILAIDTSKFGQSGAYRLGAMGDFDFVVTEKGPIERAEAPGKRDGKKPR